MKFMKLGMAVLLWLVVIFMGYKLYKIVEEPVTFNKQLKIKSNATKLRLLDIKVAQEYYKELNGNYADNFDKLIDAVKNEELTIIKTNGDPDDSTQVVTYDTIHVPIIEEIEEKKKFKGTKDVNQLRYIPLTENQEFNLATSKIKVQRVELNVFEALAEKKKYLEGLQDKFVDNPSIEDLSIGSLNSASGKGSWE